jgi:hypothetical protein
MKNSGAEILREYTFPGVQHVHGVSYDGQFGTVRGQVRGEDITPRPSSG